MAKITTLDLPKSPSWPTMVRGRFDGGRLLGVDNSVWLYRSVPLGNADEAKSVDSAAAVAEPLFRAFEEVVTLDPPARIANRSMAKSGYRHVSILLVNMPQAFIPAEGELSMYHRQLFAGATVFQRVLLLGVRLVPQVVGQGLIGKVNSIVDTMVNGGYDPREYDRDFTRVDAALTRAGLLVPTEDQLRLAENWWNQGNRPDVGYMPDVDHMHVFTTPSAAKAAARALEAGVDCENWPADDSHLLSFCSVKKFYDERMVDGLSARARWASRLIRSGAVCISINGLLEPSRVTRATIRQMRQKYIGDISERYNTPGKMAKQEQEETLAQLETMESFYAQAGATPTLIEASTIVVLSGRHPDTGFDPTDIGDAAGVELATMDNTQDRAMAETMLCSQVRANPIVRDLPAQTIAYSGLPNLATVGDGHGALLGFGEFDRQPAYLHHMAAVDGDDLPLGLAIGETGAGKSVLMTWLADQFARTHNSRGERTPVTIFDPKQGSSFDAVVRRSGGTTRSLDELASSDGVFDALRFSAEPGQGIEMACSTILAVNPWGTPALRAGYEAQLLRAMKDGVERHGARCSMQALEAAAAEDPSLEPMMKAIRDVASASPSFRAVCGSDPNGDRLAVSEGITYIRVGTANLDLPDPKTPVDSYTLTERIAVALIRNIVYGSMAAMTGRDGVLLLDEAWVITGAGRSEIERVGRLARSQRVFPMLFTQRVTDALNAGLAGYISRGIILPIQDIDEATAACQLFGLDPSTERIRRLRAEPFLSGESAAVNLDSMRALVVPDPDRPGHRKVVRGTIGIYCDVKKRALPIEIVIPQEVLSQASTNRLDVLARDREAAQAAARSEAVPVVPAGDVW